jgi:hypothetical protein
MLRLQRSANFDIQQIANRGKPRNLNLLTWNKLEAAAETEVTVRYVW